MSNEIVRMKNIMYNNSTAEWAWDVVLLNSIKNFTKPAAAVAPTVVTNTTTMFRLLMVHVRKAVKKFSASIC